MKEELINKLKEYTEKKVIPSLSDEDERALIGYSTFCYLSISRALLNGKVETNSIDSMINHLQKAISLSKLDMPLTVYHGTNINLLDMQENDPTRFSKEFTCKTFMSTSIDIDVARSFTYTKAGQGLILEINLPKDYPALWMKPFSYHPKENEVLLLNNTTFLVDSVFKGDSITYVKAIPRCK